MEENISNDLAKELLTVLGYCNNDIISKIPDYIIRILSNKASLSNKDYYVTKGKDLDDQNISKECKDLLAILYFSYIVDSNSKQELLDNWINNN